MADYESVDSRNENPLFQVFSDLSRKGREIEIKTLCIHKERENLHKIFEQKAENGRPRRKNDSAEIA